MPKVIFESFIDFMDKSVIPHGKQNKDWERLDGCTSGGSRKPFGYFKHQNCIWKVDEDTTFEKLMIAYNSIMDHNIDPFEASPAKRPSLNLIESLRTNPKKIYIYLDKQL
ncbi:hypothetical protein D3C80_1103100 [compost metagenome]